MATPQPGTGADPTKGDAGKADGGAKDAGSDAALSDAGGGSDAGKMDAGSVDAGKTDAGSPSQRAKACFEKCASSLQGCLIPTPVDGGLPKLKSPADCQVAADACRAACAP